MQCKTKNNVFDVKTAAKLIYCHIGFRRLHTTFYLFLFSSPLILRSDSSKWAYEKRFFFLLSLFMYVCMYCTTNTVVIKHWIVFDRLILSQSMANKCGWLNVFFFIGLKISIREKTTNIAIAFKKVDAYRICNFFFFSFTSISFHAKHFQTKTCEAYDLRIIHRPVVCIYICSLYLSIYILYTNASLEYCMNEVSMIQNQITSIHIYFGVFEDR